MTTEIESKVELISQPKITVDYGKGRWSRVFHLFDCDGREIALHQKDAVNLARNILKIAKEVK